MLGYIHSLVNDYGICETMAKDTILIWTKALKINLYYSPNNSVAA